MAVEIKAGATISPDYFKGLRHFRKAIGEGWTVASGVVYGGGESQRRSEALVQPALRCDELFAELGVL